jgi:uncharacterized protein (PEP-CTERM system associated)
MIILRKVSWIRLACLASALPLPVLGAQWSINSGIAPELTYTDNVCLSKDNKQSEAIALVSSNLRVAAKGRRASFDMRASIEVNNLSDSKLEDLGCSASSITNNRQQTLPRLNASANAELLEDWLYVDLLANVDQNQVNPFLPGGGDSLNRTGNTNTFTRASVSPYILRRFEDVATLELRYTQDRETNTADVALADSSQESGILNLRSNEGAAALSWGLQANYSEVEYEETATQGAKTSELASAQLNLGYQLNRYWQISGFYGEEDNDFVSTLDENDGDFWDVGFRWTPNSRTFVDLGTGERFFGSTPRASITHSYRRSSFTADYSRGVINDRDIRTFGGGQPQTGNPVTPLDPITGLPIDSGGNEVSTTTSPIIDERFSLGYAYQFRRGSLRLSASHSEQTRTEDQGEETFQSYSIFVGRDLSRILKFNASLRYSESETNPGAGQSSSLAGDNETIFASLGVTRPINSDIDLSLKYEYVSREADESFNEYDENSVTLTLQVRF